MATDVRPVIENAVRSALPLVPIERIEIEERLDHADEEAFYILVELPPETPRIGGAKYLAAMTGVSNALLGIGERRFPYVRLHYLGEEDADEGEPARAPLS